MNESEMSITAEGILSKKIARGKQKNYLKATPKNAFCHFDRSPAAFLRKQEAGRSGEIY
jgi:hypothetical protein